MKYTLSIIALLLCLSAQAQSKVLDKIQKLSDKIEAVDELTYIEQSELDQEIMELQFVESNDLFENMRTALFNKKIIDELISEDNDKIDNDLREKMLLEFIKPNAVSTISNKFTPEEFKAFADHYGIDPSGTEKEIIKRIFDNLDKIK